MLTPYADENMGDLRCGFRRNRSTTDQVLYIWQILDKKWEYNSTVHQVFRDFKKAYVSVRREVLFNFLIEFGIPRKKVGLIQTCLNETYNKVRLGKFQYHNFPIQIGLKQGDTLTRLLFNFVSEYSIRMKKENKEGFKLNGTHQLLPYFDDVDTVGENIDTIKKTQKIY
jgi:hypothetical protein